MDLYLPPDFVAWIEREAGQLPALVEDLTDLAMASRTPPLNLDERAVLNIDGKEIIGEPIVSHTDLTGQLLARFFENDGRFLGIADEKLVKVLKFAEKISLRKELRDVLSRVTVREIVLAWVGDTVRGRPTESIVARLHRTVREKVRHLTIWIPVEETHVDGEVKFADATLKMVSWQELGALIERGLEKAPDEAVRLTKEKLHRSWLGKAAIRFSLEAEPKRAQELGQEKAENYMALLQVYGSAPLRLPLTS